MEIDSGVEAGQGSVRTEGDASNPIYFLRWPASPAWTIFGTIVILA